MGSTETKLARALSDDKHPIFELIAKYRELKQLAEDASVSGQGMAILDARVAATAAELADALLAAADG